MRILLAYVLILASFTALSQTSLNGKIIDLFGKNYEFQVLLKTAYSDEFIFHQLSDSLGYFEFENIKPGDYAITVLYASNNAIEFKYTLDSKWNDTLVLTVPVCDIINVNGICPKCNKDDLVYPIAPEMFFDTWFKSKRDESRYRRKVIRQGYELTDEENGYIVWIKDVDKEIFSDVCKHWYCIRDKTIF